MVGVLRLSNPCDVLIHIGANSNGINWTPERPFTFRIN